MSPARFPCYRVTKDSAGQVTAALGEASTDDLPPGDVLIQVAYSSLNYKDALAATGHPGVVRSFPHVPGIDAAGKVAASSTSEFREGDEVLVTGFGLGAERWGGYAGYIRVPSDWVVPLPPGLTLRESMLYGTAGFTAAQSVNALLAHGVQPQSGEVVVTGATGGVGSLAVAILAKLGYRVVAVSGKPSAAEFLSKLGAARVIDRQAVTDKSKRPLLTAQWSGAVDTVGGEILATLLRSTHRAGCVTACGLVAGAEVPLTVYPFILRGVALVGIDSSECPMPQRLTLWNRLASEWKPDNLEILAHEVPLAEIDQPIRDILRGQITGRVIVAL